MTDSPTEQRIDGGSFRDPAGFVFYRDGVVCRQVNAVYRRHYDRLMGSGLYGDLVSRGLLIPHRELPVSENGDGVYRVIQPEPAPFVTYPYEWSFSQLKDAALTTLECQSRALELGMTLKDASAYNVQFVRGKPVLIDTLSFEELDAGLPWAGYRQFCEHFLAPLAVMAYVDARLSRLLRANLDGLALDLACRMLPMKAWLRVSLLVHLRLHARTQRRYLGESASVAGRRMTLRAHLGLVDFLRRTVERLVWRPERTQWAEYYDHMSYSPRTFAHKRRLVGAVVDMVRPSRVWDVGANTGVFSRVVTGRGVPVAALDVDPTAVDENYRTARRDGDELLLPLVLDITNPSPGLGWHGKERMSLLERGPADLVMALALVHHLAIGYNLPFERIVSFFAEAGRWLLVEFVPKSDPQVQLMLRSREDVFGGYTQDNFERAFAERFEVRRRFPLDESGRTVYLFERR